PSSIACEEGALDPPHFSAQRGDRDDVEASRIAPQVLARREQISRGIDEPALLPIRNGSGGTPELFRRPVTDLDERECRSVEHDEIDFARLAAIIALQ